METTMMIVVNNNMTQTSCYCSNRRCNKPAALVKYPPNRPYQNLAATPFYLELFSSVVEKSQCLGDSPGARLDVGSLLIEGTTLGDGGPSQCYRRADNAQIVFG